MMILGCTSTDVRACSEKARSYPWSQVLLQETPQAFCPYRRHLPTMRTHCGASGASSTQIVEQSHDRRRSVRPCRFYPLSNVAYAVGLGYIKVCALIIARRSKPVFTHKDSQAGNIYGRCDNVFQCFEEGSTGSFYAICSSHRASDGSTELAARQIIFESSLTQAHASYVARKR